MRDMLMSVDSYVRVSEDGVARTEFRGRRCARSQPLQTATADRTPDNYAGRKEHTEDTEEVRSLYPATRDIGVYWYLFSNHCPRRCIYETVIKKKKLSSSLVSSSSITAPSSWRSHASHVNRLTSSPRSVPSRARLGM